MNKLKLIAIAFIFTMAFSSCERDTLFSDDTRYVSNYDFNLDGAQQRPANASAGTGTIVGTYDRKTKTYSYKLTWTGLSSAVTGIHIHGVADRGFVAIPVPPLAAYPGGIVQTAFGNSTAVNGSYSGSLFVDGTVIREQDLLASKFYIDIHTTNFTGGEIRGQIIFP